MSSVFKIEPIGFQPNMQIDPGYQTALSAFEFLKILKIWKIISIFPKIFPTFLFLTFKKNEHMYIQQHLWMNMCTKFQVAVFENG